MPTLPHTMMASAVQQLSGEIEDPVEQSNFKDACLTLCDTAETVSAGQVKSIAEKFVPSQQVSQAFDDAAESCGFALDNATSLPAQGMAKRLERTLSKYGVGHGVSVLLPGGITLKNVQSSDDGDGDLTLTLKLRRRDLPA